MRRLGWIAIVGIMLSGSACSEASNGPPGETPGSGGAGGSAGTIGSGGSGASGGSGGTSGSGGSGGVGGSGGTELPLQGRWEAAAGPNGFWLGGGLFGTGDGALLASGARSLLRSADEGVTWQEVAALPAGPGHFAEVEGALLLSNGQRLFRSTDGGATWSDAGGAPEHLIAAGSTLWATWSSGAQGIDLHRSDDAGESWIPVGRLPVETLVAGGLFAGDGFLLLADRQGSGAGLLRSMDGGHSWTATVDSELLGSAAAFGEASGIVFTMASSGGLHRSFDAGASWSVVPLPDADETIGWRGFVRGGDIFYASTGRGLFRWGNTELYWDRAAEGIPEGLIALAGTEAGLFAASRERLFRFDERSERFEEVAIATQATRLAGIAAGEGVRLATTFEGKLFRGDDEGWSAIPSLESARALAWLGGAEWIASTGQALVTSSDGGRTFDPLEQGPRGVEAFVPMEGGLLVLVDGVLHRSTFPLGPFTALQPPVEGASVLRVAAVGDRLFAAATPGGLFRSDDAGGSWTRLQTDLSLGDFVAAGEAVFARQSGPGAAIWASADGGASWEAAGSPPVDCTWVKQLHATGEILLAVVAPDCEGVGAVEASHRLWASGDGGRGWHPVGEALPAPLARVAVGDGAIWAATDGAGAYRLELN